MRNLIHIIIAVLVCIATAEAKSQVLTGPITNPANGHSYYLLDATNWWGAEAEAVALGGHLVTINDAAGNAWVFDPFGNFGGVPRGLLIGLPDEGHEGVWTWTSGEPVAYLGWAPGEPNNGDGVFAYQNVVKMCSPADPFPSGSWNDISGTDAGQDQLFGVVEVVPKPSSDVLIYRTTERNKATWWRIGKQYFIQWLLAI